MCPSSFRDVPDNSFALYTKGEKGSEQQLAELVRKPVHINVEGTIHHQPDSMGSIRMASVTLVITAFMIGVFLSLYGFGLGGWLFYGIVVGL